ncbi:cytochrome P450 [Phlegmacium glaucopus]|nr:cytochrome P450 [Phlegmacium glaucopus]
MVEAPYQFVKQQMASGTAKPSFISRLLEDPHLTAEQEHEIKWSAQSLYAGGADTANYHKFSDRVNLPYINTVALEIMRWHSVVPTALPHHVMEDDIHDGYLIPKGAIILPNIWFMMHDPKVYSDPMSFNPERFLGPNMEQDPHDVCQTLADSSIFIACAMILSVFDIAKYSTKDGIIIEPVIGQKAGLISHPEPFKCSVLPRSQKALDLIKSDFQL